MASAVKDKQTSPLPKPAGAETAPPPSAPAAPILPAAKKGDLAWYWNERDGKLDGEPAVLVRAPTLSVSRYWILTAFPEFGGIVVKREAMQSAEPLAGHWTLR